MTHFLESKPKRLRLQYDRENLTRAYAATRGGMSVYRAAKEYQIPETTLRDRTIGNVSVDATVGVGTLFTKHEEQQLVTHVKHMGDIGYGYTKPNIQYMAYDLAVSLGKEVKSSNHAHLSNNWFYNFMKRWPELKHAKPQKLSLCRAQAASQENIKKYYSELGCILTTNKLYDHPENIYNIDETGVCTEHVPPKIVCSKSTTAQAVTSPRSNNVTIIAGGNAVGNYIPPYFVFAGKRWNNDFLAGAAIGSDGQMSDSGWSNSEIFHTYMTKHFVKYANISDSGPPTLVLYDGHRSHISLTLSEWAKSNNILLFVIPPHTSHLTQPLDLGIFGPFKSLYNSECQTYMLKNPGLSVTKYSIARLTSKPYIKAMCAENLISAFRKAGICPFNSKVISPAHVAPATIYSNTGSEQLDIVTDQSDVARDGTVAGESVPAVPEDMAAGEYGTVALEDTETGESVGPVAREAAVTGEPAPFFLEAVQATTSVTPSVPEAAATCKGNGSCVDFFKGRTVTTAVRKPKRRFVPPFRITGSLAKNSNASILKMQSAKSKITATPIQPVAGTSGTQKKSKKCQNVNTVLTPCSSDDENDDGIVCCVCARREPPNLEWVDEVCKWVECTFCGHWTHLIYCTNVRVIRRGSVFRCTHCVE